MSTLARTLGSVSAETEADGRDAPRVDDGHAAHGVEPGHEPRQQQCTVFHERRDQRAAFFGVRAALALAEECRALIAPFMKDRALLLARLMAGLNTVRS